MTLPVRPAQPAESPRTVAARLIVFTRHGFPEMADNVTACTWGHGRAFVFQVLAELASPIVLYYRRIEGFPISAMQFPGGSAERFAYGYVSATLDDSPAWKSMIVEDFQRSCEAEVGRAVSLMADTASQCLSHIQLMDAFDAAISTL